MVGLAYLIVAAVTLIDLAAADQTLMKQLVKTYQSNTFVHVSQQQSAACKNTTLVRRQEWSSLNRQSRLDYITAVKCLHNLPSKIDPAKAPGAKSRYDDFQAAHIIVTTRVHATGLFFAWHRWFVYLYEKALRDECGYQGYQPYWDWSKWANTPTTAVPLYDGSDTSLSGNGKYLPNRNGTLQPFPIPVPDPPAIYTAPGTGGGYIFSGPLVNWTQHLGPYYNQTVKNGQPVPRNPSPGGRIGLGYNPRPIIRDFNLTLLQQGTTYENVSTLVANSKTIHDFHIPFFSGPHLAGHSFISGVDNDLFTSPGDPLFWFHHAQVDRIYSIWQAQNFTGREYDLDGTLTLLNLPPTRNATLQDEMQYFFSPNITIGAAMSPTKSNMCYYYD